MELDNPLSLFTREKDHRRTVRGIDPRHAPHLKDTPEEYRKSLEESGVVTACRYVKAIEDITTLWVPYLGFVNHICAAIETFQNGGRRDLLLVLMELYLPKEAYFNFIKTWVKESDLELFQHFVQQGHTLYELKGHLEGYIARYGCIDVLDFFLASEGEVRILHDDIVYEACRVRNVDILDRVLVRGYPVNVPCRFANNLPIYSAVSYDGDISVLDRLIMYGVKVNVLDIWDCSPLVFSFKEESFNCLNRLVDVGARIDNERDIPKIFKQHISNRDTLLKLVEAGLDLQYRSSKGTPLEIIEDQKKFCIDRIPLPGYQYLRPRELLREYCEMESIVRDLIAENETK